MRPLIHYCLAGATLSLVTVGSFALGVRYAKTEVFSMLALELVDVQAELGHNHLSQYLELESDLSKGCTEEALAKLRFAVDGQMILLASFHKERGSDWVRRAIPNADPDLPEQLQRYVSPYGSIWQKPKCKQ